MRLATGLIAAVLTAQLSGVAAASPVNARISSQGLKFIEDTAKSLVPSHIMLDPIVVGPLIASGYCEDPGITITQDMTMLNVDLKELTLTTMPGVIHVDVRASLAATGQLTIDRWAFCSGRLTCSENINLQDIHLSVDLAVSVDGAGKPHASVMNVTPDFHAENLSVQLSQCPAAGLVNGIVGFVLQYGTEIGKAVGKKLAAEQLGPVIESALAGFMTIQGSASFVNYKIALTGVDIAPSGIAVSADIDLTSVFPIASCLKADTAEPTAIPGAAPDLVGGTPSDIGISVNLGLVQDAFYHIWHEGLLCVTPATLQDLPLPVDLGALKQLNQLIPGIPADTTWTVEIAVQSPPTIEGAPSSDAKLTVHISQLSLDLLGTAPDKSRRRLHADLDASLTASVLIDPTSNALALQVDGMKIDRLAIDDHLGLSSLGVNINRLRTLVEDKVLPAVLGQLGRVQLTGPIFGTKDILGASDVLDTYVILKEFKTTPAYLGVKANLFRAPKDDKTAPTSTLILEKPTKVVKPADAKLVFSGMDAQVPVDLLQYKVLVDGKLILFGTKNTTFVRTLKVGEVGKTQNIHVEVHAVDLAGNEDRVGAYTDVQVDGVAPTLSIIDGLRSSVDDTTPGVRWSATDDLTPAGQLVTHITVTEVGGTGTKIEDKDLAAGATETHLEGLQPGRQYTLSIVLRDQAGNEDSAAMVFAVDSGAGPGGGGCAVGGSDRRTGFSGLLVGLAMLLGARVRNRASRRRFSDRRGQ